MKRNRQQRRASTVFRLESIFRPRPDRSPLSEADLEKAPAHHILGELEDVIFVSVPETTSYHSCERLKEMLDAAYKSKKQVVIVTHNIELLKITKLDPGTAAAVIKKFQGGEVSDRCDLCGRAEEKEPTPNDPAAKIITDVH